jgi:precorrin-2/cobalt-factor-2 C20-methyltransferase
MAGTLYGLGVGPGDPELLTLKAARILDEVPVVAVPVTQVEGDSYALDIVAGRLRPQQTLLKLHFPMLKDVAVRQGYRQAAAQQIAAELQAGRDVAFLTEGDPLLHSTFIYLLQQLPPELPVEIVPGVTSITAAAAEAKLPLVNAHQRLAVLPATFEDPAELRPIFESFDTVVLLKFHRVFEPLLDLLAELGLSERAVVVERASHAAGRVIKNIHTLRGKPIHYLSLLIVFTKRKTSDPLTADYLSGQDASCPSGKTER